MRAREEAMRILEAALNMANQAGLEAEIGLGGGTLGVTRFADNEVHQSTEVDKESLAVRVVSKGRIGRAETSDCSSTGIQIALKQARMVTELLPPSEADVSLAGPQNYRQVEAYDPETDRATPLDRMAHVGRTILGAHKAGLQASGYVSTRLGALPLGAEGSSLYALANTRGLSAYHAGTRATVSVTMSHKNGATGWAETETHSLATLDVEAVTDTATRKAMRSGEVRALPGGVYTAVLEPAAVASLLEVLASSCGAEDMHNGRSFMAGRLGQKVAGESIHIFDDHAHPLHRGIPFDVEGIAKRKVSLIDGGVLKEPVYSQASARRYGAEPTGHKIFSDAINEGERASHLVMNGGDSTIADLIGGTKAGILVTRLWYVRAVEPRTLTLTGLTRDGTFLIESGEIVGPVANMRFNVSLLDVLAGIEAMSAPSWAHGLVVPALRAHGIRFSAGITS